MKANLEEMKNILLVFMMGFVATVGGNTGFKSAQQRFANVREAYQDKEALIMELMELKGMRIGEVEVHIRIYKSEKQVELWMKNKEDVQFVKVKQFKICFSSGVLGPKRRQHDLQVPEGFYELSYFNPSAYNYLSLGVSYPNKSDRIRGEKGNLGGDIAIHGGCVSVGCAPISDDLMKELYICAVEARNNGQQNIPIRIFPCHLTNENYKALIVDTLCEPDLGLWEDLKNEYDYFSRYQEICNYHVLPNGRHQFIFD